MPEIRSVVKHKLKRFTCFVFTTYDTSVNTPLMNFELLRVLIKFWRLHLRFKNHKSSVHWWRLSCLTKRVSIINSCLSQSLFSAIMQNPMEKTCWIFVEPMTTLTSGLAYKNTSSLHHSMEPMPALVSSRGGGVVWGRGINPVMWHITGSEKDVGSLLLKHLCWLHGY